MPKQNKTNDQPEKVEHFKPDQEYFENQIEMYLKIFQEEYNIDDLTTASQNVWNGLLMSIRDKLFKNTDVLKDKNIYVNPKNNIPSNNNRYDFKIINGICDYYIKLCSIYDKELSITGFSYLTGISLDTIYEWNDGRLSPLTTEIFKKLSTGREESLSAKLATGNKNPVGILAILNRHYAWNLPGVSRENTSRRALTAAELPRLSGQDKQSVVQNDEPQNIVNDQE